MEPIESCLFPQKLGDYSNIFRIHHTPPQALPNFSIPLRYHFCMVSTLKPDSSAAWFCVLSFLPHKVIASSSFQVRFAFFTARSTRSEDSQRKNRRTSFSSIIHTMLLFVVVFEHLHNFLSSYVSAAPHVS